MLSAPRKLVCNCSYGSMSVSHIKAWGAMAYDYLILNSFQGGCLLILKYFCTFYDYAGKKSLWQGLLESKKKIGGDHAFFSDN